jgi:hypothetical protein
MPCERFAGFAESSDGGGMAGIAEIIERLDGVARDLRRFAAPKALDLAVLDVLQDSDLSTDALAALLRRRRGDVLRMVKLLEASGKIRRLTEQRKWTVANE